MIRKEISDYVPEITKEINEYYKSMDLDIIFEEREVKIILTTMTNNIFTALMRRKDVHINGFFRIYYSKIQAAKRLWCKNFKRYVYYQQSYKEAEAEFFSNKNCTK